MRPPITSANTATMPMRPLSEASLAFMGTGSCLDDRPGFPLAPDRDRHHEHHGQDDAGHDAGDEQVGDVVLGDEAVHDEGGARRDQDAEVAAGGDGAERQLVVVAVLPHLRQRRLVHRHRRGDVVAADGPERGARAHGGHGQAAAQVPQPLVEALERGADDSSGPRDDAHEHEQRDDDQDRRRGHLEDRRRQGVLRGRQAPGQDEPHEAADHHREADVELEEHEAEEDARPDDPAGPQRKGAHGRLSLSMARSSRTT